MSTHVTHVVGTQTMPPDATWIYEVTYSSYVRYVRYVTSSTEARIVTRYARVSHTATLSRRGGAALGSHHTTRITTSTSTIIEPPQAQRGIMPL